MTAKQAKSIKRLFKEGVKIRVTPNINFDLDIDSYKEELNLLLEECNELNKEEEKYRKKLSFLRTDEITIEKQIEIARNSLKSIEKDYNFTIDEITETHIECPLCGTDFENSLINRFSLVQDIDTCEKLISELLEKKDKIRKKILVLEQDFSKNTSKIGKIEELLNKSKGMITLHDVIKSTF